MTRGMLSILPLAVGAALYGLAFGVLAAQAGFPWWGVGLMGAGVHAGSSQIVAVDQFSTGSGLVGAVFAGAIMNLRYLGITASLAGILAALPLWQRLVALHLTSDENWALTMSERRKDSGVGAAFLLGAGSVMFVTWSVSTAVGAQIGTLLPDLDAAGLGFAFTAAFIAMARSMAPRRISAFLPWGVTFGLAIGLMSAGMSRALAILAASLAGLALAALLRKSGRHA
ncbi:AzlC family ABC transporter permease [Afifella marina]|uniref:Predicted branched-chain amino acid permease (Azaleucine resistance) n=1 Tax=Afifella marina DSM 2698 TaxID=1120955 RepID=A0A1G5MFL0_AFIMA|nr:AzlC family ABC transporter permease [Afifella marina]MBK1625197.1 branched-chain amino acid permease [Afifella marina DSM 2698]MBK1628914.1 branched-chain amino acid permease [Afifella marina]MBK5918293.1 branched-chain amino acid permease [Afifella marina]RAI22812.1 branched-chain amino acid permease [Afifella marina DSM 2698]SCZ23936.1 Predicted branched-chain amino acid permease (azaleucine resistance) [Afifella marina DSM 2698]